MKRTSLAVIAVAALLAWFGAGPQAKADTITSGLFDIGNNEVVIQCPDYNTAENVMYTLSQRIAQGRNGGTWDGLAGITSSYVTPGYVSPDGYTNGSAWADVQNWGAEYTEVGIVVNQDLADYSYTPYTTFGGVPVNGNSVLLRYTYAGDCPLLGYVSPDDFSTFSLTYGIGGTLEGGTPDWLSGDFSYSGVVTPDQFSTASFTYGTQGNPIGPFNNGTSSLSAIAGAALMSASKGTSLTSGTQVPEPGSAGLFLCCAACLASWSVWKRKR